MVDSNIELMFDGYTRPMTFLVNAVVCIDGREVVEMDDYTATLRDGIYIFGDGERQSFIDAMNHWMTMPLDRGMIPTYTVGRFYFSDERECLI